MLAQPLHHPMHAAPHRLAGFAVRALILGQEDGVPVSLENMDVVLGNPLVVAAVEHPDVAVVADEDHPAHTLIAVLAVRAIHDLLDLDLANLLLLTVLRNCRHGHSQCQRHDQPDLHSRHRSVLLLFASVFALHFAGYATGSASVVRTPPEPIRSTQPPMSRSPTCWRRRRIGRVRTADLAAPGQS